MVSDVERVLIEKLSKLETCVGGGERSVSKYLSLVFSWKKRSLVRLKHQTKE